MGYIRNILGFFQRSYFIYSRMAIYTFLYRYTVMYIYMHTYIYMYIYTYVYSCTYTHKWLHEEPRLEAHAGGSKFVLQPFGPSQGSDFFGAPDWHTTKHWCSLPTIGDSRLNPSYNGMFSYRGLGPVGMFNRPLRQPQMAVGLNTTKGPVL